MRKPEWLQIAEQNNGVAEIPGPRHSSVISRWLSKLGAWWSDDETPWCGVFAAYCMQEAGYPIPKAYYRAKEWATYGSRLQRDKLSPGAILVFERKGGGHVGFYVGESQTHYYVLGGNQSNEVNVSKIAKYRMTASRWPKGVPVMGKPVAMHTSATETKNEA